MAFILLVCCCLHCSVLMFLLSSFCWEVLKLVEPFWWNANTKRRRAMRDRWTQSDTNEGRKENKGGKETLTATWRCNFFQANNFYCSCAKSNEWTHERCWLMAKKTEWKQITFLCEPVPKKSTQIPFFLRKEEMLSAQTMVKATPKL